MGLNVNALKGMQKDLEKKSGQGNDKLFVYSSKLGPEEDIRILPPTPSMEGLFFFEEQGYWLKGTYYVSPASFGLDCPFADEIKAAKESGDETLKALIEKKDNQKPVLKSENRFLIPILKLKVEVDSDDEITAVSVVDDSPKILVAKASLCREINRIVTSRHYQNNTEDGITDRVKGWNITVGRTGQGLDTTYTAIGWTAPMEMDAKYYKDTPDPVKLVKDNLKPADDLRRIIRNYLYGEPLGSGDAGAGAEKPASIGKRGQAKPVDETAAPEPKAKPPVASGRPKRSLLDDAAASLED